MTILITAGLLAGCGEAPEVRTYETTRPVGYSWPATEARDVTIEAGGARWVFQVPAGWVEAPEVPDQLLADFRFKGSEEVLPGRMTVSMIPGEAGGIRANITRWRQQLFLTPVVGPGPEDGFETIGGGAMDITIVQLAGQYRGPNVPTHLMGAIIRVFNEAGGVVQTWFFKMVGDPEALSDNWLDFTRCFLSFRSADVELHGWPDDLTLPGGVSDETPAEPADERPFLARPLDQIDRENEAEGDAPQTPGTSEGDRP